jgi:archaemetzincin
MKLLQLLAIGKLEHGLLQELGDILPQIFPLRCEILPWALDPAPTFHGERQQYHSSELLQLMGGAVTPGCSRLLGIASVDIYIPILTFVFGEAQIGGPSALVSIHRLRQEFYGLPGDPLLLEQRLLKEVIHELGHTFHLSHCSGYQCAMAASHGVEWIDIKESALCPACQDRVAELTARL